MNAISRALAAWGRLVAGPVAAAFLFAASPAGAAPGVLDPTFGTGGKVLTHAGTAKSSSATAMAIQPDGKILLAGSATNGTTRSIALVRLNGGGTLDIRFNDTGRAAYRVNGVDSDVKDMALQDDGKIVVATGFGVVRFLGDGRLDTTFNGTGYAPVSGMSVDAIASQPDGKVVVAGTGSGEFAVTRLNADGSLDAGFGTAGTAVVDVGPYSSGALKLTILANGKIVVAGYTFTGGLGLSVGTAAALVKLHANGVPDTNFGTNGIVTFGAGGGNTVGGIAVTPDGKFVVSTTSYDYDVNNGFLPPDIAVFRFHTNGSPDASFNNTGYVVTPYSQSGAGDDYAGGVAVQPDGKILVAATAQATAGSQGIVIRYNANGSMDTTFSGNGVAVVTYGTGLLVTATANAVAVQSDGQVVVAGGRKNGAGSDMAVARLDETGAFDTRFNRDGALTTPAGLSMDGATALAVLPDDRIVAVGFTDNGIRQDFAVMRYLANGVPDATFNDGVPFPTAVGAGSGSPLSVAVQPDGKIVAGGYCSPTAGQGEENFALVRYLPSGTLDSTFGTAGRVIAAPGSSADGRAWGLALQPDGRIVLAGHGRDGSKNNFAVMRFNGDGSLDATFNGTGKVTTPLGSGDDRARAVALQPDGKIVAVGHMDAAEGTRFAAVRYNTNGTLDATFGSAGKVTVDVASGSDLALAVAIQPDGKILLGGSSANRSAVVRLMPNGAIDTTFATAGKYQVTGAPVRSISLEPGVGLVMVTEAFRAFRLVGNGVLDPSYGTGGAVTVPFAVAPDGLAGALQSTGHLIAAGIGDDGQGESMALARILGGDTFPDAFAFTAQTAVARGTPVTSNAITVTGINTPTAISVANGTYSVGCTADFVATPSTVTNGQSVCVRHTSAAGYLQPTTTTLTIGTSSAGFTSTTVSQSRLVLSPASLSFGSQAVGTSSAAVAATLANTGEDAANGLAIGTLGDFVVSGSTCGPVLAGGASCTISVFFQPLASGGRIGELTAISASAMAPVVSIPLVGSGAGGTPGTADTPDPFSFVDQFAVPVSTLVTSAPVQITGLTGSAVATAIGGEWCVSSANNCACDVRPFSRDPGTVANNLFVCVRHVTSSIAGNSTDTQFIVGGLGDTFTTTTIDIIPAPFVFQPVAGVAPSTQLVSNAAVISGINAPSPVSVTGGEYSVGCTGTWTSTAGTVANGQTICVRHVAAPQYGMSTSTLLSIGGVTGSFVSSTASATTIPRLGNISTRMQVLTGNDVLIGGFIIGGNQPKTVVVRARGPSLAAFGITNFLANPQLQLFSGQTVIASNDDWAQAANAAAVQSSGFAPENALEAAILTTLSPGAYTAIVSGTGGVTGVGIVEVFEVDLPEVPLANISTRGQVLTGNDVMIGGFVIQGNAPQTVIVRARGPSLAEFGITNALQDPVLQLFSGQSVIAMNDDWQASTDAPSIQSRGFAPADGKEAAILITLNPGAYTAIVTGKNGGTGVGIIEVFAQ